MNYKQLALLAVLSSQAWASILAPFEEKVAWSKKDLKICFGGPEHQVISLLDNVDRRVVRYNSKQKQVIKNIISREYTQESVGIKFSGWEDCDPTASNGDIILFRDEVILEGEGNIVMRGGAANVGERGTVANIWNQDTQEFVNELTKSSSKHHPIIILNTAVAGQKKVSSDQYLELTGLHEFGHIVGMRHEHIRLSETKNDLNCKKTTNIPLKYEPSYRSTRFSGSYDPNSVMNYCYFNTLLDVTGLNFKTKDIQKDINLTDSTLYTTKEVKTMFGMRTEVSIRLGLSHLDKEAIRCMYKYEGEEKKLKCPK